MATENVVQAVRQQLFTDRDAQVFAILDGASVPGLPLSLHQHQAEYYCLYRGELAPDIAAVAPYLVLLDVAAPLTDWVLSQGWGQHWGIFAVSDVGIRELRRHFRRFLTVYGSDGKPLLFRYYDPRVLRTYLPTCNAEELATIFGPVRRYLCEDDDPQMALQVRLAAGVLRQDRVRLA